MDEPDGASDGRYWVVQGRLLAGPRTSSDPIGIDVVIDLTTGADRSGPARRIPVPIEDFATPPRHVVRQALDAIDEELSQGRTVFVHCGAGLGRTGTIIGCWLARHGTTGRSAIERIATLRADAGLPATRSPETAGQRRLVTSWRSGD